MGRGKKKRGIGGRYDYFVIMTRIEARRQDMGIAADGIAAALGIGDQTHYHKKRRGDDSGFTFEEIGFIADQLKAPQGWPFIDDTATRIIERHLGPVEVPEPGNPDEGPRSPQTERPRKSGGKPRR